jgi:hypothetical protein
MRANRILLTLTIAVATCGFAYGNVVNVDFEAGLAGDQTYMGDDAALSTPGGTLWNSLEFPGGSDLPDEFGGSTPFGVEILDVLVDSNAAAGNVLQDSGASSPMYVIGLLPGEMYSIAGYVDTNGGFGVTDATGYLGFFGFADPGADGWTLPGTEGDGGDYFLIDDLQPFEIEPGKWGVEINPDGNITGLQISGMVPEPSSLALLAAVSLLATRRR